MVADREYIERVRDYGWEDVAGLWNDVLQCSTPGWDAGKALEYLVLKGFELSGAKVRWPFTVTFRDRQIIEQIDGMIYTEDVTALVECKDYSSFSCGTKRSIGPGPISKLQGQLTRRPSTLIGCLFTSGDYTEAASILANFTKPATILCWTGNDIAYCVRRRDFIWVLRQKFRTCVEQGEHLAEYSA